MSIQKFNQFYESIVKIFSTLKPKSFSRPDNVNAFADQAKTIGNGKSAPERKLHKSQDAPRVSLILPMMTPINKTEKFHPNPVETEEYNPKNNIKTYNIPVIGVINPAKKANNKKSPKHIRVGIIE